MRETVFTLDGDLLSWEARDGSVFFELETCDQSRRMRWVWEPEDLAPMLQAALASEVWQRLSVRELRRTLDVYVRLNDAEQNA